MVNLWTGIPANQLCRKHLNAAINEGLNLLIRHHMWKGHRIQGWVDNGCIEVGCICARIEELIAEAKSRGYEWSYELKMADTALAASYQRDYALKHIPMSNPEAIAKNKEKLSGRCPECKKRMEG